MEPGQILCGFAHLAAASPQRMARLLERKVSVLSYELLIEDGGRRSILSAMSEIAGRLVPQIAASLLQSPQGRGLLLSGIPGLPAAEVTILGAGEVGFNAARAFAGLGAQVTVLDRATRLAELDRVFDVPGRFRLMYAYPDQIAKAVAFSDVLVGAILIPGERAPHVVTEEMVARMRPGSVIIDVSIDQGGCIDTSRPTSLRDPTFVAHGVTHYCVPNLTALVARTASRALSNVVRPYVLQLAADPQALRTAPDLRSALVVHEGRVVNPQLAAAQGLEAVALEELP
jgi:alanine dehydrogenase